MTKKKQEAVYKDAVDVDGLKFHVTYPELEATRMLAIMTKVVHAPRMFEVLTSFYVKFSKQVEPWTQEQAQFMQACGLLLLAIDENSPPA